MRKIGILGLSAMLFAFSFGLDLDAKVKSSFGFLLGGDRDSGWQSEKSTGVDTAIYKSIVGLTLKADDTKLYWETKFTAEKTTIGLSAAYLYVDTTLKALPGDLRIGYQRLGIADAEIHPYSDGILYAYCKDKGVGVSYFLPVGDLDVKITQLGNALMDFNVQDNTSKTFWGVLVKSGRDWTLGAIYSNDSTPNNHVTGFSIYGDYTATLLDNIKVTGVGFMDLTDDAAKAYITQKSKARLDYGVYASYTALPEIDIYANLFVDANKVDVANRISGGVKYKISSGAAGYLHCEQNTSKTDIPTSFVSIALETSI